MGWWPLTALGFGRARNRWWRLAALKDQRKIPAFTISVTHSRARGADDRGRRRRDASYGVARDSHTVFITFCQLAGSAKHTPYLSATGTSP